MRPNAVKAFAFGAKSSGTLRLYLKMTKHERERVVELINHPPPGSKIAAAKDFGIDLTLLVRKLELTPTERLEELRAAAHSVEEMSRSRKR